MVTFGSMLVILWLMSLTGMIRLTFLFVVVFVPAFVVATWMLRRWW